MERMKQMITTRGCIACYKNGSDPSAKINAWLGENPDARLLDVMLTPISSDQRGDVYVLMILELPDDYRQEG